MNWFHPTLRTVFPLLLLPTLAHAQTTVDFADLSVDSLLSIPISAASKYEQTSGEAPASVTIVTSEDIQAYGYRTLEEVFASVPGFYTSNDRNYSYLGVRGFSRPTDYNNRILMLLDGHSLNENVYGSTAIGTELGGLSLDIVDRIEIVRGPGSALYGASAMFAVVNIVPKKGSDRDGLALSFGVGTGETRTNTLTYGDRLDNDTDILLMGTWTDMAGSDLYFHDFDDPISNNGMVSGMDGDEYYGILARIEHGDITFKSLVTSRTKDVPTAAWETAFNTEGHVNTDEHQFVELSFDREVGVGRRVALRGYYDRYSFDGTYPYEDEGELFESWDASDGEWVGAESKLTWDISEANRLIVGGEYQEHLRADYRAWEEGLVYFAQDFPFSVASLFAQNEHAFAHHMSLTMGVRFDHYSTVGSQVSPRLALLYQPARGSGLKLLYGKAYRAPNVFESYYEDENSGLKGNPNLASERIHTLELVWDQRITHGLVGSLSLYQNRMNNLIDQIVDPEDSLTHYQNVSEIRSRGLELSVRSRMWDRLSSYASLSYQDAVDESTDDRLTNSPVAIVKAGMTYPFADYLLGAFEINYESKRKTVYGTETDSHVLAHINLTSRNFHDKVTLSFRIRNLFDQEYATPGGFEHVQDAIVQDGRSYFARLNYNY